MDDKNIVLGSGAANDAAADGGGITLESGNGNKTWNWVDATDAWTSSEHIHLGDDKQLLLGTSSDFKIYHSNALGNVIAAPQRHTTKFIGPQVEMYSLDGTKKSFVSDADASVELYENNSKKLETTGTGVNITGVTVDDGATHDGDVIFYGASYNMVWDKSDNALRVNDSARIKFGTHKDLHIYHNGSNSVIREEGTGNLNLQTTGGNVDIQGKLTTDAIQRRVKVKNISTQNGSYNFDDDESFADDHIMLINPSNTGIEFVLPSANDSQMVNREVKVKNISTTSNDLVINSTSNIDGV